MKVKDVVVVQLRKKIHLPKGQSFPLSSGGDEFSSKIRLFRLQRRSLHIGEGPPVTEVIQLETDGGRSRSELAPLLPSSLQEKSNNLEIPGLKTIGAF